MDDNAIIVVKRVPFNIIVPIPYLLVDEECEYKVNFGNGHITKFSSNNVFTYEYYYEGNYYISAQIRKKLLLNGEYVWENFDWSDTLLVKVKERYLSPPIKPKSIIDSVSTRDINFSTDNYTTGPLEISSIAEGTPTTNPDGQIFQYQNGSKWVGDTQYAPGVGQYNILHGLGQSPYLAVVDFNINPTSSTITTFTTSTTTITTTTTRTTTRTTKTTTSYTTTTSLSTTTTLTTTATTVPPISYLYVDAEIGDNSNPGTEVLPFKTIRKGWDVATPGTVVIVKPGVYHEMILTGNSGVEGAPITIQGTDRDSVIIRGSKRWTDWQSHTHESGFTYWQHSDWWPAVWGNIWVTQNDILVLTQVGSLAELRQSTYYCDTSLPVRIDGVLQEQTIYIRLDNEEDPNYHMIDVQEYAAAFISGTDWNDDDGSPGTTKSHIVLKNFTMEKYNNGVYATPYGNLDAISQLHASHHWELSNIRFQYVGNCIWMAGDNWYVHNCEMWRSCYEGIQVNGANGLFIDNACTDGGYLPFLRSYGATGTSSGPGQMEWLGEGFENTCYGNEFAGNYCCDNGKLGMNDWPAGSGHYMEGYATGNIVHNCVFLRNLTHGVIFAGESESFVYNNIIADMIQPIYNDLTGAVNFSYYNDPANTEIRYLNWSMGNYFVNNTIYNCRLPIAVPEPVDILTKTIPIDFNDPSTYNFANPPHGYPKNICANNIFHTYSFVLDKPTNPAQVILYNNCFYDPNGYVNENGIQTLDTNPIIGSEGLFDPDLVEYYPNYYLLPAAGSALINAGVSFEFVKDDYRGLPRPVGAAFDLGAFERQAVETTTWHVNITTPPPVHVPKTYYVDCTIGNDSNPGTQEKPLATISRANRLVMAGDTVFIIQGVYHEAIAGGYAGEEDLPITFEGINRDAVIFKGSVTVKEWVQHGTYWTYTGLHPITDNTFVMVDETSMLVRSTDSVLSNLQPGHYYVDTSVSPCTYAIRLADDSNPNTAHDVDCYELNAAFYAGDNLSWGIVPRPYVVIKNITIDKYLSGIGTDVATVSSNSNWTLDNVKITHCLSGINGCLDNWTVNNCYIDMVNDNGIIVLGNNVSITNTVVSNIEKYYSIGYPTRAIDIRESVHGTIFRHNTVDNVGNTIDLGFGIYVDINAYDNIIDGNVVNAVTHAGIVLAGCHDNIVINNIVSNMTFSVSWASTGGIVLENSYGTTTQATNNLVAFNTVYNTQQPLTLYPAEGVTTSPLNTVVNNCFSTYVYNWLSSPTLPAATVSNNCWYGGPAGGGIMLLDTHPITGNPLFTSTTWFLPAVGSSLINAAVATNPVVTTDIRGIARPQSGTSDIGAYERQATEPTTSVTTSSTYTTTTTISHTTATSMSTTFTTTTYTFTTTVTTTSLPRDMSMTFEDLKQDIDSEISYLDEQIDIPNQINLKSEDEFSPSPELPIEQFVVDSSQFSIEFLDPANPLDVSPKVFIIRQKGGMVPVEFYQVEKATIPDYQGNEKNVIVSKYKVIVRY